MAEALRVARAWGAALGSLEPVPEGKLATLLQTCASARGQPGQAPENAGAPRRPSPPKRRRTESQGGNPRAHTERESRQPSRERATRVATGRFLMLGTRSRSGAHRPPRRHHCSPPLPMLLRVRRRAAADDLAAGGVPAGGAWQGASGASHAAACAFGNPSVPQRRAAPRRAGHGLRAAVSCMPQRGPAVLSHHSAARELTRQQRPAHLHEPCGRHARRKVARPPPSRRRPLGALNLLRLCWPHLLLPPQLGLCGPRGAGAGVPAGPAALRLGGAPPQRACRAG
jgi:hypothetical protein